MNEPRSLLDWQTQAARDLDLMRANTASWQRRGIIKSPGEVRIRAGRAMLANPGAKKRKA